MIIKFFFFCLFLLNPFVTVSASELLNPIAPSELPHTNRQMKTAGFWVSRIPSPDQLIMSPDEIHAFNQTIEKDLKLTQNLLEFPSEYDGNKLRQVLETTHQDILDKNYFYSDGTQENLLFFQDVKMNMNLTSIPAVIEPQFGFVVHYADQRFLPTKDGLYDKAFDVDFDELQNNALDVGTPVAIVHKSFDDAWFYTISEWSEGWIEKEKIALSSKEKFETYLKNSLWAVALIPKADIFLSDNLTDYYDHVQMGTRLPITKKKNDQSVAVTLPTRRVDGQVVFKTAFLNPKDVQEGFLPYTPRNILTEAFLMLNAPYGWGGMYGEQDCSRFLQMVFATVGINLPRDSKNQAKVGKVLAEFSEKSNEKSRLKSLTQAPVLSILTLKGHIMLYLGMIDGRPYAIHAVWAYREPGKEGDVVRVINRVVLSELYLGEGSLKGSLLKRLTGIRSLSP